MKIQEVIMHLLLKQPFYGYVAASVTPEDSVQVPTVRMALLPVPKLVYNREWFEALKDEHAIGAVLHELLHLLLLHHFRKGNRERNLWALACDLAVNEHIDCGLLPDDAATVDKISRDINEVLPRLKSAEQYYDILSQSEEKPSFAAGDSEIRVILKSGKELKANSVTEGDSSEINKNAVESIITEMVDQAQAEGEVPSGIQSFIRELYKAHEINWRNVLKRFLSGKGRVQVRKSCKRESKRFENLPGNKRTIGIHAMLAIDGSGSIDDKQLVGFFNELLVIRKITGASVIVSEFDTECTSPVPIEKYIRYKKREKGGGTDFHPVFELADKMRIPLLIIFTDGEGAAPEHASQKVLWILTKNGRKPVEYGHSITLYQ